MNTTNKFLVGTLVVLELMALGMIVVSAIWIFHTLGGITSSDARASRNIHLFIMPLGALVVSSNGGIAYRMFRKYSAKKVKWVHFGAETIAIVLIALGIWAAVLTHNRRSSEEALPRHHFFSPHSWLGVFTLCIFGLQWIAGALVFLFKITSRDFRETFSAVHGFVGILTVLFAGMTSVMGIQVVTDMISQEEEDKINIEVLYGAILSTMIIVFVAIQLYISINPYFEWDVDDETQSPNPVE